MKISLIPNKVLKPVSKFVFVKVAPLFCALSLIIGCSTSNTVRLYHGPLIGEELEATLILPVEFDLISLDGQKVSSSVQRFRNSNLNIQLTAGPHSLILVYNDIWQIDDDNHDTLSTGKLVFNVTMTAKERFTVLTPTLKEYSQALTFVKNPVVRLKSELQSTLASHIQKENPLVFKATQDTKADEFPRLQQLKFWWRQASAFEKKQFLKWQTNGKR